MDISPRLKAGLYALGAVTGLGALAYAALAAFGLGGAGLETFFQDWVYCGVSVGAACWSHIVTTLTASSSRSASMSP